jgi:hypothetical protein
MIKHAQVLVVLSVFSASFHRFSSGFALFNDRFLCVLPPDCHGMAARPAAEARGRETPSAQQLLKGEEK